MADEKRIVAYGDRLSAAPGETVDIMVSSLDAVGYKADLVKLVHAGCSLSADDPIDGLPGYELDVTEVASNFEGIYDGRRQPIEPGSYVFVHPSRALATLSEFSIEVWIYATTPEKGRQAVLGTYSPDTRQGFAIAIDEEGCGALALGEAMAGTTWVSSGTPIPARRWVRLAASYQPATGRVILLQDVIHESPGDRAIYEPVTVVRSVGAGAMATTAGPLLMGAWVEHPVVRESAAPLIERLDSGFLSTGAHFNGRIDSPSIAARALSLSQLRPSQRNGPGRLFGKYTIAAWDFGLERDSELVVDTGPRGLNGVVINMPARSIPGVWWKGAGFGPESDPAGYSAIHFHDDDLTDAGWEADFSWEIPETTRSGIYAVRVSDGKSEDEVPIFVRPPRNRATADTLFLVPTASYLAYANQTLHLKEGSISGAPPERPVMNDAFLLQHPEFGKSLYDYHNDGHGVMFSSARRPIMNLKARGMPWGFGMDSMINAWLERSDGRFDVACDEDLHKEGAALLSRYRCVVTGSHPEYWSTPMLDALETYLHTGGRLMYLGGNGFYWRIAYHSEDRDLIEVRRTEDGTRPWVSEPGEYYHQFGGEYGGLWRRIGRSPNKLVGVGFAAQGIDGGYYVRNEAASDQRAAFIFDGVDEGPIGNFAMIGAASMEVDRFDAALGSPAHALVVASSTGHGPQMLRTKEEYHMTVPTGGDPEAESRADIVFFETPGGGAVFSVGSISWAASLSHNGYDNPVARVSCNVLERFRDPKPFEVPVRARAGKAENGVAGKSSAE